MNRDRIVFIKNGLHGVPKTKQKLLILLFFAAQQLESVSNIVDIDSVDTKKHALIANLVAATCIAVCFIFAMNTILLLSPS